MIDAPREAVARACARKGRWTLAALLALLLPLTACGGGSSTAGDGGDAGAPQRGGTLTVATPAEPVTLDPQAGQTDPGSQHAQTLIYERLVALEPGSFDVVPGLASSWELAKDKRSMTFHLRPSRFSDGSPVTAADVKFSLERARDPRLDPQFGASLAQLMERIEAPDPRTVVIRFSGPRPALLPYLAFAPCSIVSQKAFARLGAKGLATAPLDAGSGPFKLVRWTKGQRVELARNPHYRVAGRPYLDGVELLTMPDDNSRMLALRAGRVDVADEVPFAQLEAIEQAPDVRVETTPIAAIAGPWLSAKGALAEPAVRQALNYAAPKEAIREVVFKGEGELANTFIPAMKYWDRTLPPYPLDLDRARALIAGSQVADGFDLELMVLAGDGVSRQIATILQDGWSKIGVRLRIRPVDQATFFERMLGGSYEALLGPPTFASSDIPSEDEFAVNFTQPAFETVFANRDPQLRRLVARIEGTWDEDLRRELFAQVQRRQLYENPVGVPLVVANARTALREDVQGFAYLRMNWLYLDDTWLAR